MGNIHYVLGYIEGLHIRKLSTLLQRGKMNVFKINDDDDDGDDDDNDLIVINCYI